MTIANFVEAATDMHRTGRWEVSLALASCVIDATANKVHPNMRVGERCKTFLRENLDIVTIIGFPGIAASSIRIKCGVRADPQLKPDPDGYVGVEQILYHTVRCGLVHDCDLSDRIEFTAQTRIGDFNDRFEVPTAVPLGLLAAAVLSSVNKLEKASSDATLDLLGARYSLNRLWGQGRSGLVTDTAGERS